MKQQIEEKLVKFNIQILQNNEQQISFEDQIEQLKEKEQKEDLKHMQNALQQVGYKTLKFAGQGSFGTILIAEDQDKNTFAFKLIFIKSKYGLINQDLRAKALKEANIMGTLSHPNIVRYFDYFETDDYFIIKMEECKGDLHQLIKQYNSLSVESFIKYGSEIASGIQYLHDKGLVVRDLKPDNVLIDYMNVAKIADFGLAAHTEVGTSKVKCSIQGAQLFRAPELQDDICSNFIQTLKTEDSSLVLQGKKSDCFSLGLVFYSILGFQYFQFIKIIQDGPQSFEAPTLIKNKIEFECIINMLKLLCEQHPNNRMDISKVVEIFENLKSKHLSSLYQQDLSIIDEEEDKKQKEIVRLNQLISDQSSEIQKLRIQLLESQHYQEQSNSSQVTNLQLQANCEELCYQKVLLSIEIERLRSELQEKSQMIYPYQIQIQEAEKNNNELRIRIEQMLKDKNQIIQQQNKLEELEKDNYELSHLVEQLLNQKDFCICSNQTQNQDQSSEICSLQMQLQELENRFSSCQVDNQQLQAKYQELCYQKVLIAIEIERLRSELHEKIQIINPYQIKLVEAEKNNGELRIRIEQILNEKNEVIQQQQNKLEEAEKNNSELRNVQLINEKNAIIYQYQIQNEDQISEIYQLQFQLQELQNRFQSCLADNQLLQINYEELCSQKILLTTEKERLTQIVVLCQIKLQQSEQQVHQLKGTVEQLATNLENVCFELKRKYYKIEEQNILLEKKEQIIQQNKNKLNEPETINAQLHQKFQNLYSNVDQDMNIDLQNQQQDSLPYSESRIQESQYFHKTIEELISYQSVLKDQIYHLKKEKKELLHSQNLLPQNNNDKSKKSTSNHTRKKLFEKN